MPSISFGTVSSASRRSTSLRIGRASSGARPWVFDRYFTTWRAVGASILRPFSAIIRVMVRSQPSGVVRRNEMRDSCCLSSGRWQPPHAFTTV